jgi:ADP-ribosylglycohydrolase
MLGAIAGDIIGSVFEFDDKKPAYDFELFTGRSEFTDDTVLTAALADSIMNKADYKIKLKEYFQIYPKCSYGTGFRTWAESGSLEPYNSWGNGSAMRVSPVGWLYNTLEEVLAYAEASAKVTHNHIDGIKGAQATAAAIFLSRIGESKSGIKKYIKETFGYKFNYTLQGLIDNYRFTEQCSETVPQAIFTFFISEDFEDSIRKAIIIGGDSDTVACVNGSIAEAFYKGVPLDIERKVRSRLDARLINILEQFYSLIKN